MRHLVFFACIALTASTVTCAADQAPYPTKAVRLIVPFAPGGASDAAARAVGKALSKSIGQPFVVDNRPGANGVLAGQTVFSAAPDGYTLLWGVGSMLALPLVQKTPAFGPFSNFSSVTLTGRFTFGMFVHAALPAKTMAEFVNHTRANGDRMVYAAATLSEYLAAAQFMKASNTTMTRVPYKGGAQALPDLVAGRVQVYFTPVGVALPYTKDGRLRLLGILLSDRSPAVPGVPTMTEAGLPGVAVPSWQAIFGPPNMPQAIVARLGRQANLALEDGEVRQQFEKLLLQAEGSTPPQLASVVARDTETWRVFIRENDISLE